MQSSLLQLFDETYRRLRPRSPVPDLKVEFYGFANINNTIRLREGKLLVRVSDLLEGAPENVLRAIAHILVAKMYRKPVDREHAVRYRQYVTAQHMSRKAHLIRQIRGRKRLASPQGLIYDLEAIFEELHVQFFHGLLARLQMSWRSERAGNCLGSYDP